MLADFAVEAPNPDFQYWYDAQVAAGVSLSTGSTIRRQNFVTKIKLENIIHSSYL